MTYTDAHNEDAGTSEPSESHIDSNGDLFELQGAVPTDSEVPVSDSISETAALIRNGLRDTPGLRRCTTDNLLRIGDGFLDFLVVPAQDSWLAARGGFLGDYCDGKWINPRTGRPPSASPASANLRRWGAVRAVRIARDLRLLAPDSELALLADPLRTEDPLDNLHKDHPERIRHKIALWRPRTPLADDDATDQELQALVRRLVTIAGPTDESSAKLWIRVVANALMWADRELGTVDPNFVLHPSNVQACALDPAHDWTNEWRRTSRSALRRVGRAVCPDLWPDMPKIIGKKGASEPYTATDEFLFCEAALIEDKKSRQERLWLTGAPLGAGLSIAAASKLGPQDLVDLDGSRLGIRVHGDHERIVPIRDRYTDLVLEARKLCGDRPLFVPSDTEARPYNLAAKIQVEGLGRLRASRARATFVCAHIRHGTSLKDLHEYLGRVTGDYLLQMLDHCTGSVDPLDAANRGLGP